MQLILTIEIVFFRQVEQLEWNIILLLRLLWDYKKNSPAQLSR